MASRRRLPVESNNVHGHQGHKAEEGDRLSALPVDVLISILERVDLATAARTSSLSTPWRNLPWLLPELKLHCSDFIRAPCPDDPVGAARHIDRAMASLTRATWSFLARRCSRSTVTRLSLEFYLMGNYSHHIGLLVSNAIERGMVKELELAILSEKEHKESTNEVMEHQARELDRFFSACPSAFDCLTRLHLHNVCFDDNDMNDLLFHFCKQLLHLILDHCDSGDSSLWTIDAPDSNLRVLEVYFSSLERAEVLCLPKLERVHWQTWYSYEAPLRFGFVPSLKELCLFHAATLHHREFSLSQLLHGVTNMHTLTLSFRGEKIWIQPEGKQLCTAFSKLKKLSIRGIFVEFDLLWTINLLEAAPSVEIFDVEMFEHPCWEGNEAKIRIYGAQKVKPSWNSPGFTSCTKWRLKKFQFSGFRPTMKQHLLFTCAVMDRSPDLKTVLLIDGEEQCKRCEALVTMPPPIGGIFPTQRDEQEAIAKQLRDTVRSSSAQIIFCSSDSTVVL